MDVAKKAWGLSRNLVLYKKNLQQGCKDGDMFKNMQKVHPHTQAGRGKTVANSVKICIHMFNNALLFNMFNNFL